MSVQPVSFEAAAVAMRCPAHKLADEVTQSIASLWANKILLWSNVE